jgi:hypothetical protein
LLQLVNSSIVEVLTPLAFCHCTLAELPLLMQAQDAADKLLLTGIGGSELELGANSPRFVTVCVVDATGDGWAGSCKLQGWKCPIGQEHAQLFL